MKLKFLIACVIIMITMLNSADAQNRQRTRVQKHRIKEGVRSGELTRVETRNLAVRQRNTRRNLRVVKSDGVITRREIKEIRRDKRHNSRAIYRKKHNRRNRV